MTPRSTFHTPWLLLVIKRNLQALHASFKQLSRTPIATIMTFAVIGIALALPMALFVFVKNMQTISYGLHDTSQISIYLQKNLSQKQLDDTRQLLGKDLEIAQLRYISPEEGLASFEKEVDLGKIIPELKENPLPGVFVLTPATHVTSKLALNQLIDRLKRLPNVDQVQLDMTWLQRLHAIIHLTQRVTYAAIILLAIAVLLIIGNTIRLTTQYYQNEIIVTKLLGGSDHFIRKPFLFSGMIYGFVGGIIAWLLVDTLVVWLAAPTEKLASLYESSFHIVGLDTASAAWMLMSGALLGYCGSWLATHRYINMTES